MKVLKILLLLVGLFVLVIAGVMVFGYTQIDNLAKTVIERGATYALDVPTTLQKADVQLTQRKLTLDGLKVANPSGFKTDHFLTLANGGVSIDAAKLLQEKVADVPELTLSSIDVNLEKSGGKSNFSVILDNVKRFETSGEPKPKSTKTGTDFTYIIRRLEIKDIKAHAQLLPIGGKLSEVNITVPEVVLTDIGSAGDPVTMAELVDLITKAVLSSIIEVGGNQLPTELLGDLQGSLSSLSSLGDVGAKILGSSGEVIGNLGSNFGGLKGAADDAVKGIKDEADKIGDKVKDLLGGGKDK